MSKFESTLSNKKFPGAKLREFDIPDGEDMQELAPPSSINRGRLPQIDDAAIREFENRVQMSERDPIEIENEIRAAREAKRGGKERLNDGARRRIEMLVGMTRTTREAHIEDNVFVLQTLRSKEMREAIMAASEFDGTVEGPFEIRRQLLARSLISIAGLETEQFVGSNSLEAKLELIDSLPESLLHRIYDEYVELIKSATDKFSIKNIADVKGVIEDLKK